MTFPSVSFCRLEQNNWAVPFSQAVWIKDWSLCGLVSSPLCRAARYHFSFIKPRELLHLRNHSSVLTIPLPLVILAVWQTKCSLAVKFASICLRFGQTAGLDDSWRKKGGPPGRTSSVATATAGHTSARQRRATEKETKSHISGRLMAEMSLNREVWVNTSPTDADLVRRNVRARASARAHVPNGKYHGVEKMIQILKLHKKYNEFIRKSVEMRKREHFFFCF